jgi:hypothetical protein
VLQSGRVASRGMALFASRTLARVRGSCFTASFAARIPVRPFELHRVIPEFLGLPGADIANLATRVVIAELAG